MKKKDVKSKTLSRTLKTLAFALGLATTARTSGVVMPIKEENRIESHDHNHNHNHDLEIDQVIVSIDKNYSNVSEKIYKLINIKEINNPMISEYKGSSIVDALNSCGIDSSYKNRKLIASSLGIENYRGTASQNIQLLNM